MRYLYLLIFWGFFIHPSISQPIVTIKGGTYSGKLSTGLVGGIKAYEEPMGELGVALNFADVSDRNKYAITPFRGFSASAEIGLLDSKIKGGNVDLWIAGLYSLGINMNIHTDGVNNTYGIKPFAGFEFHGINFTYGYNFIIKENDEIYSSRHIIAVRYYIPILKYDYRKLGL